jgi:hypothetical protein
MLGVHVAHFRQKPYSECNDFGRMPRGSPGRRSPDRRPATPRQRTPRGSASSPVRSRPVSGSRASPSIPRIEAASRRRSSTGLTATGQRSVPSAAPLRASTSALAASSVEPPPPLLPTPAPADAAAPGSQADLVLRQQQELQELRRALQEQEMAHHADRAQVRASYARQLAGRAEAWEAERVQRDRCAQHEAGRRGMPQWLEP